MPHSTIQDAQQSIPTDTIQAAADTTDVPGNVGQDMGEAVDFLVAGDITSFKSQMIEFGSGFIDNVLPGVLKAILVFALLYLAYRVIRAILLRLLESSKHVDIGLQGLLSNTFSIAAWAFIFVMVLAQFGIDVSALLAGLSIIGLAVGFAAKDSLENFISGVTIMMDRPFRVGDQVTIDGTYGTVDEITLRSTRIRTLNNEIMVMPNMLMINQKLINNTLQGMLRIEVLFSIAYKESTDAARSVILGLLPTDSRIAIDYPTEVVVLTLGDSSVDMVLRFYVRDSSIEVPIIADYTEKIFKALKAAKIEIPFPHLQLFIDEAKGLLPPGTTSSSPTVPWQRI